MFSTFFIVFSTSREFSTSFFYCQVLAQAPIRSPNTTPQHSNFITREMSVLKVIKIVHLSHTCKTLYQRINFAVKVVQLPVSIDHLYVSQHCLFVSILSSDLRRTRKNTRHNNNNAICVNKYANYFDVMTIFSALTL